MHFHICNFCAHNLHKHEKMILQTLCIVYVKWFKTCKMSCILLKCIVYIKCLKLLYFIFEEIQPALDK